MEPGAQGIYVRPDSPIKSLADLRGRTIAINAPKNILYLRVASVLAEHGIPVNSVKFVTNIPFPGMPAGLKAGTIDAAVLPEPFASVAEQADGAVPPVDLDQGATTNFPVEGYVVTKQWAEKYPPDAGGPRQGAGTGPADRRHRPGRGPAGHAGPADEAGAARRVQADRRGLTLDDYPFTSGPVDSVDRVRLQRVVDVMQQFLGFDSSFSINSMLTGG
jgi:NitT/TauT family transport system substrate-binding protein